MIELLDSPDLIVKKEHLERHIPISGSYCSVNASCPPQITRPNRNCIPNGLMRCIIIIMIMKVATAVLKEYQMKSLWHALTGIHVLCFNWNLCDVLY